MAIVPMQKINLFVHKEDKPNVLDFLQSKGVLHITNAIDSHDSLERMGNDEEGGQLELAVAQLDFAVNFLVKYEEKKKGLQAMIDGDSVEASIEEIEKTANGFEFKEVVARCQSVEEELNSLHNEEKAIISEKKKLNPWKSLASPLNTPRKTENIESFFVSVPTKDWNEFKTEFLNLSELVAFESENITTNNVYVHIISDKSLLSELNVLFATYKVENIDLPEFSGSVDEKIETLDFRLKQIKERQSQLNQAAKELAKDLNKLRIIYDYLDWKRQRKTARSNFASTESTVLITGWMPKKSLSGLRDGLTKITDGFELLAVEPKEEEIAPVLMRNNKFMSPFRAVTDVYGLPKYHEVDPTPYLAIFFILYFGMCLTDAGYGIIMFTSMWLVLKYLKIPKGMQNMVRLLMYAGIVTFIMGILFGGWFGMTPEQAPSWLTTVIDGIDGEPTLAFIGQKFNALNNAMQVLILSLGLGLFQTVVGVWINFLHNFRTGSKKDAILDNFPWVYMLMAISIFILVASGVLPAGMKQPMIYIIYSAVAFIVLTQGRKKSSLIGKAFSGILSLYDLVGYMSDVLSYSRLLALGLATAIIGMAVNTIAGLVGGIPVVGIILTIIVLIIGHTFNLGINALGSFIHSGRLQFVEFFGKFIEGGGSPFTPLRRKSKFVQYDSLMRK